MNPLSVLCFTLLFSLTARAQVHLWHGEYDASDERGDCWGERQGGVTFAPGVQGMAFFFDGVDDIIRFSRAALPPPWTLALWVKRQDAPGLTASLLYDTQTAIELEQFPGTRKVGFTQLGVANHAFNYTLPAGRWVHLTLTASASATTLYIDGLPVQTLPVSVALPRSWFGGSAIDRLRGQVDEMQVWNEVLEPAAVLAVSRQVFNATARRREWNPPVRDALGAMLALTRNGTPLGFGMGAGAHVAEGLPSHGSSHYQGIARWEKPGWVPYLFVGRSGYDTDEGNVVVVEMASRGRDGERMRGNRLRRGAGSNSTEPPPADRVVRNIKFPYRHVGALQIVGDILAVALEDPQENRGLPMGRVMFYDISNPLNAVALPVFINTYSHNIGVIGMTRLPDGHYLLVMTWGSNEVLHFYRSNGTSFTAPGFGFGAAAYEDWYPAEVTGGDFPTGAGANFQCLSLFNQEDGGVYMIGARNLSAAAPAINGDDVMQLYRITGWHEGGTIAIAALTGEVHKDCSSNGDPAAPVRVPTAKMNANFLASTGHYVSPGGELLFYATEHWNDGPGRCVRVCEFHHNQVARPGGAPHYPQAHAGGVYRVNEGSLVALNAGQSLPVRVKPWIELYDGDDHDGDSVMVDWDDYFLDDYDDLREMSFNDQASSLRWYAPPGYSVILYDSDHYVVESNEPYLTLGSTSWSSSIANLSDPPWEFDNLDSGLHETRVTSLRFTAPTATAGQVNQPLGYAWQIPAADQQHVSFIGSAALMQPSVRGLDGPRLATASVSVTQPGPFGNVTSTVDAIIEVVNLPPVISSFKAPPVGGTSGRRVRADLTYNDAGTLDAHSIHIQWGDGTSETIAAAAGTEPRNLLREHLYLDNDPLVPLETTFTIILTITDDDGGSAQDTEPFRIIWRTNSSKADGDTDSLPDYWEDTRLLTRTHTGAQDTDGDGRTNIDEYRAGTDPRNSSDYHELHLERAPNGTLLTTFTTRAISGSGYGTCTRHYRLESSSTLVPGSWQAVPGYLNIQGAGQAVSYAPPAADGRMFLRCVVWLE